MASLDRSTETSTLASRPLKSVYSVSRLVREVRLLLENSFPLLWVEGELSNLSTPSSGHWYFSLKENTAQVRCACFRGTAQRLNFTPTNGMQVLLRVRVSLYEGRGDFQLIVEHMEPAGTGALQRAFEALKQRLGQAGWFDGAHKKPLPTLPRTIGLVSSPSGAAVHDIISVLKRRAPFVQVQIYPTAVQGEAAIEQIVAAIALANAHAQCDLLIVGRGGGSMEDLWCFNDERVARAIFESTLPIISAVGHEVDVTIADYVADLRAPTPSAAAEMAVPDGVKLLAQLRNLQRQLDAAMRARIGATGQQVTHLHKRLPSPARLIQHQQQQLTHWRLRLTQTTHYRWQRAQQRLDLLTVKLKHPKARIAEGQRRLQAAYKRLHHAMLGRVQQQQRQHLQWQQRLQQRLHQAPLQPWQTQVHTQQRRVLQAMHGRMQRAQQQWLAVSRTLEAVSPLSTLERGYSMAQKQDSTRLIRSVDEVHRGETIRVRLHHGQLLCEVKDINE